MRFHCFIRQPSVSNDKYNLSFCFKNTNEINVFILFLEQYEFTTTKMGFTQSLGTLAATITLCLFVVNLNIETCSSQQMSDGNDYSNARIYTPDTGLLDFVYHSHEDMTRFLR